MSEGRVRLRLADEGGASELPEAEESARVVLPAPSIAVAAAHEGAPAEAMADALARAAVEAGQALVRWRALLGRHEGATWSEEGGGETVVCASVRAFAGAIAARLAAMPLPEGAMLVALGPAFVAACRPTLSILVTGGASPVQWDPAIRRIRDRFELTIAEPRARLAHRLVAGLGNPTRCA